MRFDELGLAPEILRSITEQGYTDPTPIQQKAIPLVLAGHDLKACAQTGTGKTAAFTLPLLQRLLHHANSSPSPARHPVRALILAPTRELAIQVYENVKTYSQYTPFRSMVVYGGVDIKPQIAELKKGVEFLVATPGRLLDHVEQKTVSFNSVEALVLDEADRMLDMGFIPDIKRILNLLPGTRQSLLFSATFSDEIKKLADSMLREPVMVEVARQSSVSETISHRVHPVSAYDKRALLTHLLKSDEYEQVLVFTRTKQETGRLARELIRSGISADAIHGDKTQIERSKALDAFKNGSVKVLVATDVAARGLDIEELPHVINYELPRTPEDYVHRIGRTGRAGKKGKAISLVSGEEVGYLVDIEKLIKLKIEQVVITGFEPDADYEYPPSGKRKKPAHSRSDDQSSRSSRSKKHEKHEEAKEKHERGHERNERRPRPQKLSPQKNIAADGFDFSKPYEPRSDVPASPQKPDKPDPHKPKRAIPALLGGMGRK